MKPWKKYVEGHDDKQHRKMWTKTVQFFNAKKKRFEGIRGDIGAHFLESAAKWSIERLHQDTTGTLEIPFATELVASVILKTAREQDLPDDQMQKFISGIFDDVASGWRHAGAAVQVVIAESWLHASERLWMSEGLCAATGAVESHIRRRGRCGPRGGVRHDETRCTTDRNRAKRTEETPTKTKGN